MIQIAVNHISNPNKLLVCRAVDANLVCEYESLAQKFVPSLLNPILLQPSRTESLHLT